MRIIVTGGAGFIGSHVCDALLDQGHDVLVVDDLSTGRRDNVPPGAAFECLDIRDAEAIETLFSEFAPQVISHQAAQTSVSVSTREPTRDADVNILGTIALLEAAVRHRVERFVFASTGGAIYGEVPPGQRAVVGAPTHPLSPYACSKLACEHYIAMYATVHGLATTVLRYANVYGPRQDPHGEAGVVAIFSRRLIAGEPIQINAMRELGDAGCVRDYVFVEDVVRANAAAVAGEVHRPILNVCTGMPTTTTDIAEGLQKALGVRGQVSHGPRRPGDLEYSVLDPDPATELLGSPVSLEDGLNRTAQWFRQHA